MTTAQKLVIRDDIAEFIKTKFAFKHVSCSIPDAKGHITVEVSFDNEAWRKLVIYYGESRKGISELVASALLENKWDDAYTLHTNSIIVKEIMKQFNLYDCGGYVLEKNMLCKIDFETNSEFSGFEEIVDLSTVKDLRYAVEENDDLSVLILTTDTVIYEIRYDGYTCTKKKSA
jgi:hypothetical protein